MKFRRAFHTNRLTEQIEFYTTVIGLEIIGEFKNHAGYDGVFLGKPRLDWELEFTQSEHDPKHNYDDDDLLVFYPESVDEFNAILHVINSTKTPIFKPKNPYWIQNGIYIKDPDDFGIIISNQSN